MSIQFADGLIVVFSRGAGRGRAIQFGIVEDAEFDLEEARRFRDALNQAIAELERDEESA